MMAYLIIEWKEWLERDLATDALAWAIILYAIPLIGSYQPFFSALILVALSLAQGWRRGARYHQVSEQRKRLVLPSIGGAFSAVAAATIAALISWAAPALLSIPLMVLMARLWSFPPAAEAALLLLGASCLLLAFGISFLINIGTGAGLQASSGSIGIILFLFWCVPGIFVPPLAWTSPAAQAFAISSSRGASPWGFAFPAALGMALLGVCALILRNRRRSYHGE